MKCCCLKYFSPYSASMAKIHWSVEATVMFNVMLDLTTGFSESGLLHSWSLDVKLSIMDRTHSGALQCGNLGNYFLKPWKRLLETEGIMWGMEKQEWSSDPLYSGSPCTQDQSLFFCLLYDGSMRQVLLCDPVHHRPSLTEKAVKIPKKGS